MSAAVSCHGMSRIDEHIYTANIYVSCKQFTAPDMALLGEASEGQCLALAGSCRCALAGMPLFHKFRSRNAFQCFSKATDDV
jgi:hypothetical protein